MTAGDEPPAVPDRPEAPFLLPGELAIDTAIARGELATGPDDLVALLGRAATPLPEALRTVLKG